MKARFFFALLSLISALCVTRRARAQQVEVNAMTDTDVVEIGDALAYTQQVMVHGGAIPSDPKPGATPGFSMRGTSSSPVHMRMNTNGIADEVRGLVTTWTLRADRVGTFTLGPSQITIQGARKSASAVQVRVVERGRGGGRTRQQQRPTFDPFGGSALDPFKGLFDFDIDDHRRPQPAAPTADPKLAMEVPRAPVAFLHATIDKTRAVVGEQVTLSVYLYQDPYVHPGRPTDVHEATANDFVKRSLLDDEKGVVGAGTAMVGGRLWNVQLVRKTAFFPLKSGHLTIEPMSLTLPHARVGLRASETLHVDVVEPPLAGRPAGYAIGDVGDMSLQATVTPRATTRGGAIGVTIELRGTGNLPSQLTPPVVPGVEWLEPQVRDKLGPMQDDRFGGSRTFSYVVRMHKDGAVDLTEVGLPFYDPSKRTYGVARAALGTVNVAPGSERDAGTERAEVLLAGMPKARRALEGRASETYLSERPAYWVAVFGSPLLCVLGIVAHGLSTRLREARARRAPSPERVARGRRAEVDVALRADDGKSAMGAILRALEAEVLAKTGVNVRGASSDVVARELEDANVDKERAQGIVGILRTCEDARFSPHGVGIDEARTTWSRAREMLDALGDRGKSS